MPSSIIQCLPLNSSRSSTSSWPKWHLLWSGRGHTFCKDWAWCQPHEGNQNPQRRKHSSGSPVWFERAGLVTGEFYNGETKSDYFTDSVSTLSHGDLCSAARPHHYMQLMNSELICLGFFLQGPWEDTLLGQEYTSLQRYGSVSLHRHSDQWHGLLSAPLSPKLILFICYKKLLQSKGWLYRLCHKDAWPSSLQTEQSSNSQSPEARCSPGTDLFTLMGCAALIH